MALVEEQKRQKPLTLALVIIVIASAGVLYFGKFRQASSRPGMETREPFTIKPIESFSIPQGLFTDKNFLQLDMYPQVEAPSPAGRENPFES